MYIGNSSFFHLLGPHGHGLFSTTIYIPKKVFFGIVEKSDFFDTTVINSWSTFWGVKFEPITWDGTLGCAILVSY